MRHDSDAGILVRASPLAVPYNVTMASHTHEWDQLTFAAAGAMQIETMRGNWLVPTHGAVWVPSGVEHAERLYAGASLWTLHFRRSLTKGLPRGCRTVTVSPFLRELILRVSRIGALTRTVPQQARLARVLLDEMRALDETPLHLPLPRDARALQFARLLDDTPDERASVTQLARRVGASRRTLERVVLAETGLSVGEWRQRRRLLHAVRLLAARRPVHDVARASGYTSVSAFIAMFRRTFGATPNRYRPAASLDS